MPDPVRDKRPYRSFTVEEKKRILAHADACQERGALGALLRRERIYSSQLQTWRRQLAAQGEAGLHNAPAGRQPLTDLPAGEAGAKDRPIETLRREKTQLEQRLRLAEGLLELQKKPSRCWNTSTTGSRHEHGAFRAPGPGFPARGLCRLGLAAGLRVPLSSTPTAPQANGRRPTQTHPAISGQCLVGRGTRARAERA